MRSFRAHPLSRFALLTVLITASACAAPLQNGGVEMRPGAEERLDLICRYRATGQQVCDPAASNGE